MHNAGFSRNQNACYAGNRCIESEMELQKEFDPFVFKKKLLSSAVHPRSTEAMSLEKITSK